MYSITFFALSYYFYPMGMICSYNICTENVIIFFNLYQTMTVFTPLVSMQPAIRIQVLIRCFFSQVSHRLDRKPSINNYNSKGVN